MGGYEKILPGAADRILSMAEQAQDAQLLALIVPIQAEASSLKFATYAFSLLPYGAFAATGLFTWAGESTVAVITASAGLLSVGPRLIRSIKAKSDTPNVEDIDEEQDE